MWHHAWDASQLLVVEAAHAWNSIALLCTAPLALDIHCALLPNVSGSEVPHASTANLTAACEPMVSCAGSSAPTRA
jgi:hypothetical protein